MAKETEQTVYTHQNGSRTDITTEGVSIPYRAKETISIEVAANCVNIRITRFGEVAVIQVSKETASELINAVNTALKQEE